MSNLTQLDVANQALAVLDEAPIHSFEEDTKAARLLNLHFETTREAELAKHATSIPTSRARAPSAISPRSRIPTTGTRRSPRFWWQHSPSSWRCR
jgi:hypothetical protein